MAELPATLTPVEDSQESQNYRLDQLPWGRLVTFKMGISNIDLLQNNFTFGRSEDCTVTPTRGQWKAAIDAISRQQFQIQRNTEDNLIYITDLSKNGTYINSRLIGKDKKRILRNDDVISIAVPNRKLYVFMQIGSEGLDVFLPETLSVKYAYIKQLGRGSCGEVHLVKHRNNFNSYAIKKIILGDSALSRANSINHPNKIQTEINILKSMKHPFIINMKEFIEENREVYIVLEYMAGGELSERIDFLTEDNARFFFYQMLMAVNFLHKNGVVHRDLKPENILLSDTNDETLLKITDFGLSKMTAAQSGMASMCGTLRYAAPEIISSHYSKYGKEVDIWSLGVILYYMLTKQLPFDDNEKAKIARKIVRGSYKIVGPEFNDVSKAAKDLIGRMLVLEPNKRIKLQHIFKHPWIKEDKLLKYKIQDLINATYTNDATAVLEPPTKRTRFDDALNDESSSSSTSSLFSSDNLGYLLENRSLTTSFAHGISSNETVLA